MWGSGDGQPHHIATVAVAAVAAVVCAAVLSACGFLLPQPGPGELPEPIGPVVEIGRGESLGIQWRYSVYDSDMGFCTRIETDGGAGGSGCGGAAPGSDPAGGAIQLISFGTGTGSPSSIEGYASDEVAEVWIEVEGGARVAATLMPLAPAGLDGQLWLAYVPEGLELEEAVAIGADGEVLGRQPVNGP
jgi:hypothetical protein